MTTETDLPPSSVAAFTEALKGARGSLDAWLEVNDESEVAAHIEAYASACVSSATAEKDAEIEALRAEVETLRDGLDYLRQMQGVPDVLELRAKAARAERLAEALRAERRWWVDRKADAIREQVGGLTRGDPGAIARCDAAIQRINAALRDQEEGHEQ